MSKGNLPEKGLVPDARCPGLNSSYPLLIKHLFRGIVAHHPTPESLYASFKTEISRGITDIVLITNS